MCKLACMLQSGPQIGVVNIGHGNNFWQQVHENNPNLGVDIDCYKRETVSLGYAVGSMGSRRRAPALVGKVAMKAIIQFAEDCDNFLIYSKSQHEAGGKRGYHSVKTFSFVEFHAY